MAVAPIAASAFKVNNSNPAAHAAALKAAGFTGTAGTGGGDYLRANPAAQAKYTAALAAGDAAASSGTGVVPLSTVPMNTYQTTALDTLANPGNSAGGSIGGANRMLQEMTADPAAFAAKYLNPQATEYMGKAGEYTQQGAAPITLDEVNAVATPFSSALKARLTESGAKARAALLANQGTRGARSFGDTVQGTREGMLDQELLSKGNDIDYQGFEDAKKMLSDMRARSLQAGGQFGNLSTQAQGNTASALGLGVNGATTMAATGKTLADQKRNQSLDRLGAGQSFYDWNKEIANKVEADIMAEQADPQKKISDFMTWIKGLESGTGGAVPGANGMETAGGIAGGIGDIINYFSQQGKNVTQDARGNFPWQYS